MTATDIDSIICYTFDADQNIESTADSCPVLFAVTTHSFAAVTGRTHLINRLLRPLAAASLLVLFLPATLVAQNTPASATLPAETKTGTETTPLTKTATNKTGKKTGTSKSRTTAKSPNIKRGQIISLNALNTDESTIIIRIGAGNLDYALTENTLYLKGGKIAAVGDFKSGETVVAHVRRASGGLMQVSQLADPASWMWFTKISHDTTACTLKKVEDGGLDVTIGTASVPMSYTTNDKTLWWKNGKEAAAADFAAGSTIYISPRSTTSGTLIARVVTDNEKSVDQVKEHTAATVNGTISALDAGEPHKITLTTAAGETRTLDCTKDVEVRRGTKTLMWTSLKTGQHLKARMQRDENDKLVAWRVTIGTTKSRTKKVGASSMK